MSFGRDSYHHGNLREALVEAARRLIAERGLGGFAFAELARAAGVSPAAPYRHFRDRGALVAELALRGFAMLREDLLTAWNDGRPDPAAAIERCGRAYLHFARRDPAAYAAMFDGTPGETDPALRAAADAAFAVVRNAAEAACAAAPTRNRPPALMVALHVWTLCHGTASLFTGPPSPGRRPLPMTPEDLLEAGLLVYLRSLGLGG
ncbi:TetR/AcrR family transcriptional regulator [Acidisphaera sp. L21]|uniref:TetR/AcrR family transcriptional regulator n=1 Tax=Acidisphaera sp. L21 TaxID=1641851 RepID=UPI00131B3996|nr:TetR/AcrR family transcriptional regulator [Acidisphaera sp. L21]